MKKINQFFIFADSPAIPPSATAHELFRGFSFVNPSLFPEGHEQVNGNDVSSFKVFYFILFTKTKKVQKKENETGRQ